MNEENLLFQQYIKTGDRRIFEELFRMTKPWIYKLIYRIIPDKDIADEIFQETWIQVLKYQDKYDFSKGKFNNYLYTIAKNRAIKMKYNKSKFVQHDINNEINEVKYGVNDVTPYNLTEISEKNSIIMKAIKTIDQNYQDVIILHYFADLDVKEIAENLDKPEGTIKTWLARGREQLRKRLQKSNLVSYLNPALSLILLLLATLPLQQRS